VIALSGFYCTVKAVIAIYCRLFHPNLTSSIFDNFLLAKKIQALTVSTETLKKQSYEKGVCKMLVKLTLLGVLKIDD